MVKFHYDFPLSKRSFIHIQNCQIKSIEKAKLFCKCLDTIEKEFGIKEVDISIHSNNFICPDIDLTLLANSKNHMERLIGDILINLDKRKYGKESKYVKEK